MELSLRETGRGRWNKLDILDYRSINLATEESLSLSLKHQKPFYFSKWVATLLSPPPLPLMRPREVFILVERDADRVGMADGQGHVLSSALLAFAANDTSTMLSFYMLHILRSMVRYDSQSPAPLLSSPRSLGGSLIAKRLDTAVLPIDELSHARLELEDIIGCSLSA